MKCIGFTFKISVIAISFSLKRRPKELRFSRGLIIPKKGSVFDYVYLRAPFGNWYTWQNGVEKWNVDLSPAVDFNYFILYLIPYLIAACVEDLPLLQCYCSLLYEYSSLCIFINLIIHLYARKRARCYTQNGI